MSARALNWAWAQQPKTTSQKLVLAALGDRADEDGFCWPGTPWIAEKCAPMSRGTARRVLTELAEQGFVMKEQRRRRPDGTLGTWELRLPIDQRSPVTTGDERSVDQRSPVREPASTGERAYSRTETNKSSTDVEDGTDDSKTKKQRKPDELWDTFVDALGFSPTTKNGRGRWNAGIGQLRAAGATAETLAATIKAYRKEWPEAELSPTAIATHWDRFQPKTKTADSTGAALTWAKSVGWQYDGSALEDELALWAARGVDETTLREAVAAARPPIEKLAAMA